MGGELDWWDRMVRWLTPPATLDQPCVTCTSAACPFPLHRSWVAVPWEFLRFNLLAGASAQYGRHAWHWNLSQGLPVVAASLLPLMAAGLLMARHSGRCTRQRGCHALQAAASARQSACMMAPC